MTDIKSEAREQAYLCRSWNGEVGFVHSRQEAEESLTVWGRSLARRALEGAAQICEEAVVPLKPGEIDIRKLYVGEALINAAFAIRALPLRPEEGDNG